MPWLLEAMKIHRGSCPIFLTPTGADHLPAWIRGVLNQADQDPLMGWMDQEVPMMVEVPPNWPPGPSTSYKLSCVVPPRNPTASVVRAIPRYPSTVPYPRLLARQRQSGWNSVDPLSEHRSPDLQAPLPVSPRPPCPSCPWHTRSSRPYRQASMAVSHKYPPPQIRHWYEYVSCPSRIPWRYPLYANGCCPPCEPVRQEGFPAHVSWSYPTRRQGCPEHRPPSPEADPVLGR